MKKLIILCMSGLISGVWGAMGKLCCIRRNQDFTDSVPQDKVHQVIFGQVSPNVFDFLLKSENLQIRACSSSLKAGSRLYFWTEIEKFFAQARQNHYLEHYGNLRFCEDVKKIYEAIYKLSISYSFNDPLKISVICFTTLKDRYSEINQKITDRNQVYVDCNSSGSLLNLQNIRRIQKLIAECGALNADDYQIYKKYLSKFLSLMLWMRREYLPYDKQLLNRTQPSRFNILKLLP